MKSVKKSKCPGIFISIFQKLTTEREIETLTGDFEELYERALNEHGKIYSFFWFAALVIKLTPSIIYNKTYWSIAMFKNYLKIGLRNISRQKVYSTINISGLAIGLACSIMILLWVLNELNYDTFHENSDTLYLVGIKNIMPNRTYTGSGTPPALGPALTAEYPEVVNSARLFNGSHNLVVMYKDKIFRESIQTGDFTLLGMFTFPLVKGNIVAGHANPNAIYISESKAVKYFGDEDPIGKVLTVDNQYNFTVTGIMKDFPGNSIFQIEMLVPLEFNERYYDISNQTRTWTNLSFATMVQVRENTDIEAFNAKINKRIVEGNGGVENVRPFLRKYSEIYLYGMTGNGGNIERVYLFTMIAVIVLALACINFMNLTTARSITRAKEVGMRKVVGARKSNLIFQFLGESLIFAVIAFTISIGLVYFALPAFNDLAQTDLSLRSIFSISVFSGLMIIVFFTGIISGSYPAFFLAGFRPERVIKGLTKAGKASSIFRNTLVVLQFCISIGLIICTLVVNNQIAYVGKTNLGYNKDNIVYIPVKNEIKNQYFTAKQEFLKIPGVLNISSTQAQITGVYWNSRSWSWEGKDAIVDPMITYLYTDQDFAETFDIDIILGRYFQIEFESGYDESQNVIINETFAELIGKESPVGKHILDGGGNAFNVVGVIKDFNYKSLYNPIEPIVIFYIPQRFNHMYIRLHPDNIDGTMGQIEETYKTLNPDYPFEYRFLDDRLDRMYSNEKRFGNVFRSFAVLTIIISCLGLFGLASYITVQRSKEIGIRKILGASISGVVLLITKEFTKWVVIANIIAWPVAGYYMNNWLDDFAYRTNIGFDIYFRAGITALLIAILTVSFQAIKVAASKPVDSLRNE
ncbi:MAG: FtsX-like permease family protein [bacterium]|nr:FtsX-like permease family protein [bacterium]